MVAAPDDVPKPSSDEPIFVTDEPAALPIAEIYDGDSPDDVVVLELVEEETEPQPPASIPPPPLREIVLLGAGHAHLQIVQWWRRRPLKNTRLTLISTFDRAAYSGMLAGVIAGRFRPEEMLIDLPRLCAKSGVQLIVDRAIAIDPTARRIELAHQPAVSFNAASINIGSVPGQESLWQSHRMLVSVKPMANFWSRFENRLQELLSQWREAGEHRRMQFVVVGAGTAGTEVALCLEERIHNEELPIDVHLVDEANEVWRSASPAAIRRVRNLLKFRGIELHLGQSVEGCDEDGRNALVLGDGSRLRCDLAIWTTVATPPTVLRGFPFPRSPQGFLQVDRTLRVSNEMPIFAAGDIAEFPEPIPKAVASAVRQGPILWHNLRAVLAGQPLKVYEPQRDCLVLLACGDGTAILDYKRWAIRSRWPWWLKCAIDKAFMRRFR